MDEEVFVVGGVGFALGFLVAIIFAIAMPNRDLEALQKNAIEHGYAEYYEGKFLWKDEVQEKYFIEDFRFFKRNEDKLKPMAPPDFKIDGISL